MKYKQTWQKRRRIACKPCRQSKVKCDAIKPACGNCLDHGRTCRYWVGTTYSHNKPEKEVDAIQPPEEPQNTSWDGCGNSNLRHFVRISLAMAKQSHLGWLCIEMALELRRPTPREGEQSFPCYLYELYGMLLWSVGTEINLELGPELVVAMIMLIFFEIAIHACPEPAIQHLRGLEALIAMRKSHLEQQSDIPPQLDDFASELVELAGSVMSARRDFHPRCLEHPDSMFTWNVCVDSRPQLAQLRDYVAGTLETMKAEILLTTDGLLEDAGFETQ